MSTGEHLNPSAYIDLKNLPREYDALKAKYDVLFREYLALSSEAARLERQFIRYLASDWIVVSTHSEPQRTGQPNNQPGDMT
nr:MAG TPA: Homeobox associated leucine zipper [Caudoviricetes sp.]